MLDIFLERFRQKHRTVAYPKAAPALPPRFRGRPFIDAGRCPAAGGAGCDLCRSVCPTGAISRFDDGPGLDMGLCTFCGLCASACPQKALAFTTDWRLASTDRRALMIRPLPYAPGGEHGARASSDPADERRFSLPELPVAPCPAAGFSRSFRLRQVTAAGCGACEADLNVLTTVVFDISRFGMDFVASPRHADGLVLTGPVPRNMREALIKCHNAMPAPKPLIAVGACAISGGLFRKDDAFDSGQQAEGCLPHLPADLFIPGCPPHPYTELDGLLRFLGCEVPAPA